MVSLFAPGELEPHLRSISVDGNPSSNLPMLHSFRSTCNQSMNNILSKHNSLQLACTSSPMVQLRCKMEESLPCNPYCCVVRLARNPMVPHRLLPYRLRHSLSGTVPNWHFWSSTDAWHPHSIHMEGNSQWWRHIEFELPTLHKTKFHSRLRPFLWHHISSSTQKMFRFFGNIGNQSCHNILMSCNSASVPLSTLLVWGEV